MAKVFIEESSLSAIGDAIRGKTGKTDLLPVADMPGAITGIETGIDTGDATATAADIRKSKTAYAKGAKITGTLSDATQATPSITVSTGGLITASATQTAGYVTAGTKSATKQLSAQAAKTITPSSSEQTAVAAGKYTTGVVKVAAIPSTYTQLNFNVVSGTSQPSSPAANTIWVNTSTSITSWVFSATQPTSPTAGMVWFQTSTSATAAFNALKKNNITVYPTGCKQYISGAWVDKTAKTYQGSTWVDWWAGELYDSGNEYTGITGGWQVSGMSERGNGTHLATLTKNTTYLQITHPAGEGGCVVEVANDIDLTNFSTLTFTLEGSNAGYGKSAIVVYNRGTTQISSSVEGYENAKAVKAWERKTSTVTIPKGDYSVDVSSLSGKFALGYYVYSGGGQNTAKIYKGKLS